MPTLNQGYVYTEQLGAEARGQTALSYLAARWRHSPETVWHARLSNGEVTLDGQPVGPDAPLRPGQRLAWSRPPWEEEDVPLDFEVLHEDPALVAVSKPGGLPTIPSGGFLAHTLLTRVRLRWPEARPLHRLGRGTSGLVLFARDRASAAAITRDWPTDRVLKRYRGLASGIAAQEHYAIRTPIGPVPHPRLSDVHGVHPQGKAASSDARVLERRDDSTLFEVDIHTGRAEQIRIHLAAIGHPLVGDPLYAPGGLPRAVDPGLPGDGGYLLHAMELRLIHPVSGLPLHLVAPPPPILRKRDEGG
ncbi:MAG TPA: RluA family pseudouridine synthase [Myxococcaceae bacterium]|nr:RluA family pseudouridine synthase [Myxococcaceae bacterium]